ncbi:MAG: hypothetical protein M1814_005646 [Vezdaea aestivalis]|nr:MAG: hypothetical protein M1814_005646 [Vezdaea aestivalis]
MEGKSKLTGAKIILLAVHYAAKSDLYSFATLATVSSALSLELMLRVLLTFLPESTEPRDYIPLLQQLSQPKVSFEDAVLPKELSAIDDLSDGAARKKARRLRLLSLISPSASQIPKDDLLTHFLIQRAYSIDSETGLLRLAGELVVPFLGYSQYLRAWFISVLLPLLRMNYDYRPQEGLTYSLKAFEYLGAVEGVKVLISKSQKETVGRDLRCLVGPWAYGDTASKRRKLSSETVDEMQSEAAQEDDDLSTWSALNQWLVETASTNFELVAQAIEDWDGPTDTDYGGYDNGEAWPDEDVQLSCKRQYIRASLASVYNLRKSEKDAISQGKRIVSRISGLMDLDPPTEIGSRAKRPSRPLTHFKKAQAGLTDITPSYFGVDSLLSDSNLLTLPGREALEFLASCLDTITIMQRYGRSFLPFSTAQLCLVATEADQQNELKILLHGTSRRKMGSDDWERFVDDIAWVWNLGRYEPSSPGIGIFGKIEHDFFHKEVLQGLLSAGNFPLATTLYISTNPLPLSTVERLIHLTAMTSYDNATNGNRTRGGMKRSCDILKAFYPAHFPKSTLLSHASALISATHALSFYSLTLQHGVPFAPVNIRVTSDPLSLIQKVLEQNPRAYTNVDDLASIGRDLASAGLLKPSFPNQSPSALALEPERRVLAMCIDASLSASDFETAYSYVMTRLTPSSPSSSAPLSNESPKADTISYTAALLAGRFRPVPQTLRTLEMRLELLSTALLLAPPQALHEILAVWRRAEEELSTLRAEDERAEMAHADGKSRAGGMPGAWTNSAEEGAEPPMGLFDVARGAAKALGKSTGALRAPVVGKGGGEAGREDVERREEAERVRKRDVVSNMVTGGLASGIGWVLGAQPVARGDGEERERR